MNLFRAPLIAACLLACASACSSANRSENKSSEDAGTPAVGKATLRLNVQAPNSGAATSTPRLQGLYRALSPSDFCNSEIASGPPNAFSVTIRKMTLLSSADGSKAAVPIFDDPAGKTITITGSRVDLSDMFTKFDCVDNAGNAYTLKPGESCDCGFDVDNNPMGTVLDPSTGGQVCPWDLPEDKDAPDGGAGGTDGGSRKMRGAGAKVASLEAAAGRFDTLEVLFSRKARISGCVTGNFCAPDAQSVHGEHTYCTQASKAFYGGTGGGENADFEDKLPGEEMDFDLRLACKPDTAETVPEQYSIRGGLELTEGATAPLNLVVDLNRMLRFYNQARPESPCGKGLLSTPSYFFTSVFDSSVFVFAGKPGAIQGYQLLTQACTEAADADVPPDYVCTTNPFVVAVWLTVVLDDQGAPILASFQPDDDNTLTVIKGATSTMTAFGPQWDPSAIAKVSDGVYNLTYRLGTENESGTVFNIDTRVGLGEALTGVKFRGFQGSYGVIAAHRRL